MKSSHKAIEQILSALTDLARLMEEMNPGATNAHQCIRDAIADARKNFVQATAYEN